jgi:hypothetical protein
MHMHITLYGHRAVVLSRTNGRPLAHQPPVPLLYSSSHTHIYTQTQTQTQTQPHARTDTDTDTHSDTDTDTPQ